MKYYKVIVDSNEDKTLNFFKSNCVFQGTPPNNRLLFRNDNNSNFKKWIIVNLSSYKIQSSDNISFIERK